MKITIINGNPYKDDFDDFLLNLNNSLRMKKRVCETILLRDTKIKQCMGCFGCWVKKPGECLFEDDTIILRKKVINSDLVLYASPLKMGFISSILKKALDKHLPLLMPYFSIRNGEVHHMRRYTKYPKVGILIKDDEEVNEKNIEITRRIFEKVAIDMVSEMVLFETTRRGYEEVSNEIDNI